MTNEPEGQSDIKAGRSVISVAVVIILILSLLGILWKIFGDDLVHSDRFAVSMSNIVVTPEQPEWIKEDVLRTVVKQHNLDDLFLDDRNLTKQIADAFTLHSWIAEVVNVRKRPVGVDVVLRYRKPVAMVEVKFDNRPHVLPIDAQGVVLPPGDFDASDIGKYLRIAADHLRPNGNIGDPWGDKKIVGAASVATLLNTLDWKAMQLYRIEVTLNPEKDRAVYYIVMRDHAGIRVLWGSEPGDELGNEQLAQEKLKDLNSFFRANQTLKISTEPTEIDLRSRAGVQVVPLERVEPGSVN